MGELIREFLNLFRGDEPPFNKIMKFILVLALIFGVIMALESAMGLVTIGRLEREVNLLKELSGLAETGLGSHNQLDNMFANAVNDLKNYNPNLQHIIRSNFPEISDVTWIELVFGAVSWILLGLLTLNTTKGGVLQKSGGCAIISLFGLAVSYVIGGMITTSNPLVAIPLSFCTGILAIVLLVIVAIALSPRKNTTTEESEKTENGEV